MLDELRSLSWLPRSLFKQMRALDQAVQKLTSSLGREPEEQELADELGIPLQKLQKLLRDINCSALVSLEDTLFAPPAAAEEEGTLEKWWRRKKGRFWQRPSKGCRNVISNYCRFITRKGLR